MVPPDGENVSPYIFRCVASDIGISHYILHFDNCTIHALAAANTHTHSMPLHHRNRKLKKRHSVQIYRHADDAHQKREDVDRHNTSSFDIRVCVRPSIDAIVFVFITQHQTLVRHPLFSLLALMLEKCEQATQGYVSSSSLLASSSSNQPSSSPNGSTNGGGGGGSGDNADSFSRDVHAFVHILEKEKGPLLTNNAELDGLVCVWGAVRCCYLAIDFGLVRW